MTYQELLIHFWTLDKVSKFNITRIKKSIIEIRNYKKEPQIDNVFNLNKNKECLSTVAVLLVIY